jgi:hypothetical protein
MLVTRALVGAIEQAVKAPAITARLASLGILQSYATPEQTAPEIRAEFKRVGEVRQGEPKRAMMPSPGAFFIAVDGVHHPFKDRVQYLPRVLGIAVGQQFDRAFGSAKRTVTCLRSPSRAALVRIPQNLSAHSVRTCPPPAHALRDV